MTLMKPLSRVLAVVVGRSARIWWQRLPKEHKFQARLALLQHRWSFLLNFLHLEFSVSFRKWWQTRMLVT
jgi:hypothetical protein